MEVIVSFNVQRISVNKESFEFSFSKDLLKAVPADVALDDVEEIWWNVSGTSCFMLTGSTPVFFTEDKYEDYIKPFVDIWQAEKDKRTQEQLALEQNYAKYENRKARAINIIRADYNSAVEHGFVRTSLGFDADISPKSSATLAGTQASLAYTAATLSNDEPKTDFLDFNSVEHKLDASQVGRLIYEINYAQNYIRGLKHIFKTKINDETNDNDSLNAVLETCVYNTLDFSKPDESGNPITLSLPDTAQSVVARVDATY